LAAGTLWVENMLKFFNIPVDHGRRLTVEFQPSANVKDHTTDISACGNIATRRVVLVIVSLRTIRQRGNQGEIFFSIVQSALLFAYIQLYSGLFNALAWTYVYWMVKTMVALILPSRIDSNQCMIPSTTNSIHQILVASVAVSVSTQGFEK
jgi:hypothetical protein